MNALRSLRVVIFSLNNSTKANKKKYYRLKEQELQLHVNTILITKRSNPDRK